jgi:hypothetical protein
MTSAAFYNLRPGQVVSSSTIRAVVATGPVATRRGFVVELRIGRSRRFINPQTAAGWSLDA